MTTLRQYHSSLGDFVGATSDAKPDRYINLAFGRGHFALSLCEELFNIFARVIMNASQWLHTLHLSHNGSKKTKLISQRRLNQIGDKGARG